MPLIFNPMLPFNFEKKDDIRIFVKDEEGNDVDITEYVATLNSKLADKVNTFQGSTQGNKVMITDPQGNITTVEGVVMNISEREKLASLTNPVLLKGIINSYEALYQVENPQVGWCYYVRFANGENDNLYEEYVYTADHGWELFGHFNASAIPQYVGGTATEIDNTFHVNLKYDPDVFEVDVENRLKIKDLSYVAKCKTLAEINALSVNDIFHWQGANDQNIVVLDPNGTQTYIRFGYFYKKGENAIQRINKERESNAKEIVAGEAISITEDAQNDRITINSNYDNEEWGIGKNRSNQLKINGKFVKQVEDLDAYTTAPINEIVEYIGEDGKYLNAKFYKRIDGQLVYANSGEPIQFTTINIPSGTTYLELTNKQDNSIKRTYQLNEYQTSPLAMMRYDGYLSTLYRGLLNSDYCIGNNSRDRIRHFKGFLLFKPTSTLLQVATFKDKLTALKSSGLVVCGGINDNNEVELFTFSDYILYLPYMVSIGSSSWRQSCYYRSNISYEEAKNLIQQYYSDPLYSISFDYPEYYSETIIKDKNGNEYLFDTTSGSGFSAYGTLVRQFINDKGEKEYLYSTDNNNDGNTGYFLRKANDDFLSDFYYIDADLYYNYNYQIKQTTEALTLRVPSLYDNNENYLPTTKTPSYWQRVDVQLHNVVMMYLYNNIASYYQLVMCTEENGNLYEPQQPDSPNPAHRVDYEDNVFYYATNTNKVYTWSELDQTIAEVTNSVIISGDVNTLYVDTLSNQTYRYNGSEFVKLRDKDKADEYPTITVAETRTNIEQGDSVTTIWGKIKKFFTDLADLAFINKPSSGQNTTYLRGDGTWQTPPNTTYSLSATNEKVTLTPSQGSASEVSLNTLINGLETGTSDPQDDDYIIAQYAGGGTTTTTYHRRPLSKFWNWIKTKLGIGTNDGTFLRKDGTWATPTDTKATVTTTGSGNAITSLTASNGALTATKGSTFLTSHQDISGKVNKSGDTITGTLILSKTQDASGIANNKPALIIGGTDTQAHIEIDNNEIIAKSNGTTSTTLYLQDGNAPLGLCGSNYSVSNPDKFRTAIGAGTSSLAIGTTSSTAAAGNHTHTTTIATSSGTNQITLAASTKYAITAGGTSYVFTTPPNTNTTYSAGTGLSLSSTTFSVSYGTTAGTVCQGNDSRLSNSRPASDVYAWAKSASLAAAMQSSITSGSIATGTNCTCSVAWQLIGNLSSITGYIKPNSSYSASGSVRVGVTGTYKQLVYFGGIQTNKSAVFKLTTTGYIENEGPVTNETYYFQVIGIKVV